MHKMRRVKLFSKSSEYEYEYEYDTMLFISDIQMANWLDKIDTVVKLNI